MPMPPVARFVGLTSALLLRQPVAGSAQQYQVTDLQSPAAFTTVEEMGRDKRTRRIGLQPSVIVDNDSRITVTFDRARMERAASPATCAEQLEALRRTDEYAARMERARAESLSPTARDSARADLMTLAEETVATCGGFEISLRARVIPREGNPFDLPIPGYAVIEERGSEQGDTLSQTITTFLRHGYGPRLVSVRGEPQIVALSDVPAAIVDLPDDDSINEGDHIELTVANTFGGYTRSWVWDLEVRDVGFKATEDASLLLIKRIDEPAGAVESNFKPTAGGSFMMTVKSRSRFLLAVQPSLGFNASFVDFEQDKDLEIGLGIVFSLFGSTLQISYGWDLHADDHREYWAVGIGFIDLADRISGKP